MQSVSYTHLDVYKRQSLSHLLQIPSVAVETPGEYPFGENVQKAYDAMLDMAREEGFAVYNADNYGGHIDFTGKGEGIVGVVGHLDLSLIHI